MTRSSAFRVLTLLRKDTKRTAAFFVCFDNPQLPDYLGVDDKWKATDEASGPSVFGKDQ
jgi:hypothetical protein